MQGHNQVEIKNYAYECVNSYCRSWKVLWILYGLFYWLFKSCLKGLILNFYTANSISTAYKKFISQNLWGSQHFLDIWIHVEFMFKSLLRYIKCMPLNFCDLLTTSMYLHKRVCAIITLRRISEIVNVQNFISSLVIKQMIHLIFLHNPLFIYRNAIFIVKNCMIRLSQQLRSIKYFHDDVILTSALRSYIC